MPCLQTQQGIQSNFLHDTACHASLRLLDVLYLSVPSSYNRSVELIVELLHHFQMALLLSYIFGHDLQSIFLILEELNDSALVFLRKGIPRHLQVTDQDQDHDQD